MEGGREGGKKGEGIDQKEEGTAVGSGGYGQTTRLSQRLPPL